MTSNSHADTLLAQLSGFEPTHVSDDTTAARIPTGTPVPDASGNPDDGPYPRVRWAMGDIGLLDAVPDATTITGSRSCTTYGANVAAHYAEQIARRDGHVLSGIAYGIETAAVRGVLAAGGAPIVVLACGINRVFPVAHLDLANSVLAAGGLLLSLTTDPDAVPSRSLFHRRSWWMGAITTRTLLVEGSVRSSAMTTIDGAKATGARVGAVPGPVTSATSALPNKLLAERPQVLTVHDDDSLMAFTAAR